MPSPPRAATADSRWCTVGDTRVHYVQSARSDCSPNLLLLHGYLGSTVPFLDLIDALSDDLGVTMPDLPPFGESGLPSCECEMGYYVDLLSRFSDAVGLEQFYLAGTSMGANIAAHYAATHPDQVQGLIFLSPFGLDDQAGRMTKIERWDSLLPLATSFVTRGMVRRWLSRSIRNEQRITAQLVDAYWKPFRSPEGRRAVVSVTRRIIGGCSMDAILPELRQPVLILVGSEDKMVSAEEVEKLRRLLKNERLRIIEESGHFLYLDSPDVVSREIATFTTGGQ
jgi:pimeloyl-ACP methyl ester carboxylesterase